MLLDSDFTMFVKLSTFVPFFSRSLILTSCFRMMAFIFWSSETSSSTLWTSAAFWAGDGVAGGDGVFCFSVDDERSVCLADGFSNRFGFGFFATFSSVVFLLG